MFFGEVNIVGPEFALGAAVEEVTAHLVYYLHSRTRLVLDLLEVMQQAVLGVRKLVEGLHEFEHLGHLNAQQPVQLLRERGFTLLLAPIAYIELIDKALGVALCYCDEYMPEIRCDIIVANHVHNDRAVGQHKPNRQLAALEHLLEARADRWKILHHLEQLDDEESL